MRRLGTCSVVLLALILISLPAAAQVVQISPMSYDFGKMEQNEVRQTLIEVTNAGAGRLEIERVDPDCGCTVAEVKQRYLAPGETTEITLTFDSKTFQGKTTKMVHIYTNDPNTPVVDVALVADVHAAMIIEPRARKVSFRKSKTEEVLTDYLYFTATDIEKLEISVGETKEGIFEVTTTHAVDGDPRKARINVVKPAGLPIGRHDDEVRVTTNIPEHPYVDITLFAESKSALKWDPSSVRFRYKKKFRREIRITPFIGNEHPFQVSKVEIDVPGIKAKIIKGIPNKVGRVMLTGSALAADDPQVVAAGGKMKGTLKIHTTSAEVPLIEIPVSYMVRM